MECHVFNASKNCCVGRDRRLHATFSEPILQMEDEDYTLKAQIFNVHPCVLERLHEIVPFRDTFLSLTSGNKPEDFWRQVDTLPSPIALELHALGVAIPTSDLDFPPDSLTPYFQDFWLARHPGVSISNCAAVTRVSPRALREYLDSSSTWTASGAGWTCPGTDVVFSFETLLHMCDAFATQGRPWIFCPVDEIRGSYMDFDKIIERLPTLDLSAIQAKLRAFEYKSTAEFVQDMKVFSGNVASKLADFVCPPDLSLALSQLMHDSEALVRKQDSALEIAPVSDWVKSRADALVNQTEIPIERRNSGVWTQQVLQARTGQNGESVFERESLAELLFSNPQGDVMPLPYTNCRAELPAESPLPRAKAVFRAFVAKELMKNGYEKANESVLDILTDVIMGEVKRVATDAASKVSMLQKGTRRNDADVDIVKRALNAIGYDIFSMTLGFSKGK